MIKQALGWRYFSSRSGLPRRVRGHKARGIQSMSVALDRHRARSIAHEPAKPAEDISALIARLTAEVNEVACEKTKSIQKITTHEDAGAERADRKLARWRPGRRLRRGR